MCELCTFPQIRSQLIYTILLLLFGVLYNLDTVIKMSSKEGDGVDFCNVLRKGHLSNIWPEKSVHVVKEIINTEQAYVTDLDNIVKVSIMWSNA